MLLQVQRGISSAQIKNAADQGRSGAGLLPRGSCRMEFEEQREAIVFENSLQNNMGIKFYIYMRKWDWHFRAEPGI